MVPCKQPNIDDCQMCHVQKVPKIALWHHSCIPRAPRARVYRITSSTPPIRKPRLKKNCCETAPVAAPERARREKETLSFFVTAADDTLRQTPFLNVVAAAAAHHLRMPNHSPDRVLVYGRVRPVKTLTTAASSKGEHPSGHTRIAIATRCKHGITISDDEDDADDADDGEELEEEAHEGEDIAAHEHARAAEKHAARTPCDIAVEHPASAVRERVFHLDGAFDERSTQREVYDAIGAPVLTDVLNGCHGCILAYGQTGSGKTHSLLNLGEDTGATEDVGLLPRYVAFVAPTMPPLRASELH